MNSLANLNAVVDDQGEASTWHNSDDHDWDPPVATLCTAAALSDHSHLRLHPPVLPRQDWNWSDSQLILASQYNTGEEHDIDCKHAIINADSLTSEGDTRLRQYNAILTGTNMTPSLASMAMPSSWPELLNAVPVRQTMGLDQSSSGSCYNSPSFYGGGVGLGSRGAGGRRAFSGYYAQHSNLAGLGATDIEQRRLHDILRREIYTPSGGVENTQDLISARIGLNLGGRTYFSAEDSTTLARFHASKRFRPHSSVSMHVPLCQAEGCKTDLSIAKHYHRRHKVCEYHSKSATAIINGNTQRFCQQCSRFHALGEFDEGKRSCRKRLADHNRRRRKPQPPPPASAAVPVSSAELPTTSSTGDLALIPTEQDHVDGKSMTTSASQQANGQKMELEKESGASNCKPVSSTEHRPSLLSTMALNPSILQLTLQNSDGDNNLVDSEDGDKGKVSTAYHISSQAPFLLNGGGPSLSLSSHIPGAVTGTQVGGAGEASNVTTQQHIQSSNPTMSFPEVELSVPWFRAHHHVDNSSASSVIQESLGRSPVCQLDQEEGVIFASSARSRQVNENGQYLNIEHGRLLMAEQTQSLHSQAASRTASNSALSDHHASIKADTWIVQDNAVGNNEEEQTVLSLLETASEKDHQHHHHHPSLSYNHHQDHHHHNALVHAAHHHHREQSLQHNARHSLGFAQTHHPAMNSSSSTDNNHEASEAALSLQCMQVFRPLSESLYPTAEFMKDDFA